MAAAAAMEEKEEKTGVSRGGSGAGNMVVSRGTRTRRRPEDMLAERLAPRAI